MIRLMRQTDYLIHVSKTGSTMSDAISVLSLMNFKPDNLLIIAGEQIDSIGRNNSKWLSPKGGLWFTFCLKASQIPHQITLLLGLWLLQTFTKHYPGLFGRLQIKWPNDLILEGNKLSGILVQHQQGYLVIGIGINTNNEPIDLDVPFPPVSLKQFLGIEVAGIALLNSFLDKFHDNYAAFQRSGLQHFYKDINCNLLGKDQTIIFDTDREQISGTCKGISEDGALLLEQDDGILHSYYSGSIINSPV